MKISIIYASDEEVEPFIPMLVHDNVSYKSILSFHK